MEEDSRVSSAHVSRQQEPRAHPAGTLWVHVFVPQHFLRACCALPGAAQTWGSPGTFLGSWWSLEGGEPWAPRGCVGSEGRSQG